MKKSTFFFSICLSLSLYPMELPVDCSDNSTKDDEYVDETYFADGNMTYKDLLASKEGRRVLLTMRASERKARYDGQPALYGGLQMIKPALCFGRRNSIITDKKKCLDFMVPIRSADVLSHAKTDPEELAHAIADTEYFLICRANDINIVYFEWYIQSLQDDTILLREIVSNDETIGTTSISEQLLTKMLTILEPNHAQWPPKIAQESHMPLVSAYTVLKKLIQQKIRA